MASKITNVVRDRKAPKGRGKPVVAKAGNYESLLAKILHENSKFAADCANSLPKFYENILKMANKEDEFKAIGVKDQWAAMKFCMDLTEKFLDEHYEAEAEEEGVDSTKAESTVAEEGKANGTTGATIRLISSEDFE